jgi:alanyl-tRNA synthetase
MQSAEIRKRFLKYFEDNGHTTVRSSSLVPAGDQTLLFTNAGMNQFKDVFLGNESKPFKRAASSQKCVRAGGKHNDLENVGFTARHHTFFEMLGNFSFGDYFKKDAIRFAWEFLTTVVPVDPSRMVATIFGGDSEVPRDEEAYKLWLEILPKERIYEFGKKDNFWAMGDVGPCGPCSEVHYRLSDTLPCPEEEKGLECKGVACECDRWLELWNLVFMQYERGANGVLSPLPAPCVDTGMGLERLSAVSQGVLTNYDTDLIRPIIAEIEKISGRSYCENEESGVAMRVVADHIRSSAFLISDGVLPSNEGRGYVLRKIIRRAIRYEKKLGIDSPALPQLVEKVSGLMGEAYPEIIENRNRVRKILQREEEVFASTLSLGLQKLEEALPKFKEEGAIPGDFLFKLYDTYGFPLDLAGDIAKEKQLSLDTAGFENSMKRQRELAKASWKNEGEAKDFSALVGLEKETSFVGYDTLQCRSVLLTILRSNEKKDFLRKGEKGFAVFSATPFYAESGGQVGDSGRGESENCSFMVLNTTKALKKIAVSEIEIVDGELKTGTQVYLHVDERKRRNTEAHHTATHLLHSALREVLGDHVKQAGSLVGPDHLRFDFQHFHSLDEELISAIEEQVNEAIWKDIPVSKTFLPLQEALNSGAMALFDEKYGDVVRVVEVEGVSKELCGGCHVDRTGRIGIFKILDEKSVASGTRRIEAVCEMSAYDLMANNFRSLRCAEAILKMPSDKFLESLKSVTESNKSLEKEVELLKLKLASSTAAGDEIKESGGTKFIIKAVDGLNPSLVKNLADSLREKMGSGIVVIGNKLDEKVSILVAVTPDLLPVYNASKIVKELGKIIGGGGGGKPEIAEAGGKDIDRLKEALDGAIDIIEQIRGK